MTISNIQAAKFALVPGRADAIAYAAEGEGNMAWVGIANSMIYPRNALYCSVAITTIAITGSAFAENTMISYGCNAIAVMGFGLTCLSAKKLSEATSFFKSVINNFPKNR